MCNTLRIEPPTPYRSQPARKRKNDELTSDAIIDTTENRGIVQIDTQDVPTSTQKAKRCKIMVAGDNFKSAGADVSDKITISDLDEHLKSHQTSAVATPPTSSGPGGKDIKSFFQRLSHQRRPVSKPKPPTSVGTIPPASKQNATSSSGNTSTSLAGPSNLAFLTSQLPLPSDASRLTRSQRIYTIHAGINHTAFVIRPGTEYYLFMDMRAEHQWASFKLNPRSWTKWTHEYNDNLELKNQAMGIPTIRKNPRALVEHLAQIEDEIFSRLLKKYFKCAYFTCFPSTLPLTTGILKPRIPNRPISGRSTVTQWTLVPKSDESSKADLTPNRYVFPAVLLVELLFLLHGS